MNRPNRAMAFVAALAAFGAGGCLPDRVTIDLAPGGARLQETTVFADAGAGDGAPKVAMIDVRGLILDAPTFSVVGPGPNPVDELTARLDEAGKGPSVRPVGFRINSPAAAGARGTPPRPTVPRPLRARPPRRPAGRRRWPRPGSRRGFRHGAPAAPRPGAPEQA
ncbi:MAG: hypothetical protein IBJ10_10645, partial [Phycisphaerales bacterium]|nr:hypothetical protein [Phycisphaerales bacterium]